MIVFDEAHRAKNIAPSDRAGKGTKTAEAVLLVQAKLPQARVLYVSATAAADTKDLGYMPRLGLWGRGAPFADFGQFASGISRAGVGAMELVAMDMKARGMFVSRMLSFAGCSFEKRICVISSAERDLYDVATDWWTALLHAFDKCVALTGSESTSRSYWSAHQSFFKQLLNSLKASFAIVEAEAAISSGECVVIGLLSTGESKSSEVVERESKLGRELESEVSTPHETARVMLQRHLPTSHKDGAAPVAETEDIRDELLHRLESIRMPGNALDLLISHFGVEKVAEMTGRKMRIVTTNCGRTQWQPRLACGASHEQINLTEKHAFLSGKKPIAVISEAASSGISLHADKRFPNTKRRLHVTLELAWSAEKMLQQFGRTHRSNQVSPPRYVLLVTDLGGEQRFASSVARRLELLGAMTRGDRRGGHGAAADLVQYNLDTAIGHTALALMLDAVSEQAEREQLWDRALRMLRCHREGVPTLLGLCVVAVAQQTAGRRTNSSGIILQLPRSLQQYVSKLQEWASPRILQSSTRPRAPERATYGRCPKTPCACGLTWVGAGDALRRIKLFNAKLLPTIESDRYNVNKFLNRLLGLPVAKQNALFCYFLQVILRRCPWCL